MSDKLAIIVPCYNEEEVLPESAKRLKDILSQMINDKYIDKDSQIVFIDDGSKDKTWKIIKELSNDSNISGIKLSRNYGHQNALICGLFETEADIYVSIDADLQDDINVIKEMVKKYKNGCDIVYGVRKKEKVIHFSKDLVLNHFIN